MISSFVVGDRDDEPEAKRNEHFSSYMDTTSGADVPEATVFDCVIWFVRLLSGGRASRLRGVDITPPSANMETALFILPPAKIISSV
jgi:hypothetical protein